jgi:hypothetical protein
VLPDPDADRVDVPGSPPGDESVVETMPMAAPVATATTAATAIVRRAETDMLDSRVAGRFPVETPARCQRD